MTGVPRELAGKRPANTGQARDDGRAADGHLRAVHGGVSGVAMFRFCLLTLVVCLFIGLLLGGGLRWP